MEQWLKLNSKSKERVLAGEVITLVARAGQICRELTESDEGIDMEIEFRSDHGQATGQKVYLQLKSGDTHLKKRKNGEIFKIENERHASYWRTQAVPVWLVIRASTGKIRWMEISKYLKRESDDGKKRVRQIVFTGKPFNVESILDLRDELMVRPLLPNA
jgi:hypothetical protein